MEITFDAIDEDMPGDKWRQVYDRHWHSYSRWFLREGIRKRSTYLASKRALRQHMPELVPTYEAMCDAAGGGDLEARFLSMWCPPAYVGGCSQAIVGNERPILIRNYDYGPKLLEGTWLRSRYCGTHVVAMVDCLWGVLDGINEHGLAVSLAFGGNTAVQEGFGIPLVLRYILETTQDVAAAVAVLMRVPVHMAYSVAIVDRAGSHVIVFLTPGRPTEVLERRVATNHQHQPAWKRHAETTKSVEREQALMRAIEATQDAEELLQSFLAPPVRQTAYNRGYGTLYTAMYDPETAGAELIWPSQRWRQTCGLFTEDSRTLVYDEGSGA